MAATQNHGTCLIICRYCLVSSVRLQLVSAALLFATSAYAQRTPTNIAAKALAQENLEKDPGEKRDRDRKWDPLFVPILGGNTDFGIIFGGYGGIVASKPGSDKKPPYDIRIEINAVTSVFPQDQGVTWPYQEYVLMTDFPRFPHSRLRLGSRIGFYRNTKLIYFGMGNVSSEPSGDLEKHYEQQQLVFSADLRYEITDIWYLRTELQYSLNHFEFSSNSTITRDLEASDDLALLLSGTKDHHSILLRQSLEFDTRDNEIKPNKGWHNELYVDASPQAWNRVTQPYFALGAFIRAYKTLIPDAAIFAFRLGGEMLFGSPAFYKLGRIQNEYAIGGPFGIRGVPATRYYGRGKLISNFEMRFRLWKFDLFGEQLRWGFAAFTDIGRVWARLDKWSPLDGNSLGLKWGAGLGLRFFGGKAFVFRIDAAYSPDAKPIGAYALAGHAF